MQFDSMEIYIAWEIQSLNTAGFAELHLAILFSLWINGTIMVYLAKIDSKMEQWEWVISQFPLERVLL